MRILYVLGEYSSPHSGGEARDIHLLRALERVGAVDTIYVGSISDRQLASLEARLGTTKIIRLLAARRPAALRPLMYIVSGVPYRVARRRRPSLVRELRSLRGPYDLIAFRRLAPYLQVRGVGSLPFVVDMDDLESEVARLRRTLLNIPAERERPTHRSRVSAVRRTARNGFLVIEQSRWRRAEARVVRRAEVTFLCSDEDRLKLEDTSRVVVAPNGYSRVGPPLGRSEVGSPPVVAFWGLMAYWPNSDGARWLVNEVLPTLVMLEPDVRVLIAGGGSERIGLPAHPNLTVLGFVPDLSDVLTKTDVSVVPLRLGGGTRIKIIEAWAHRIPVVSTSVGAHGLGAQTGHDLVIEDDPTAFAFAVHRVLRTPSLREQLTERGSDRAAKLDWAAMETGVSDAIRERLAR